MYFLQPYRYGWQRFGEYMDDTFLDPFIEGSWMTKHNGKYYLQYGAPGTEFSGYSDRCRVREWCREHIAVIDAIYTPKRDFDFA